MHRNYRERKQKSLVSLELSDNLPNRVRVTSELFDQSTGESLGPRVDGEIDLGELKKTRSELTDSLADIEAMIADVEAAESARAEPLPSNGEAPVVR